MEGIVQAEEIAAKFYKKSSFVRLMMIGNIVLRRIMVCN
jgi:hypothetical protein